MQVNLTSTLDEYVLSKVKSGRYNNASEVIREALRRMQDEEAHQTTRVFDPNFFDPNLEELEGVHRRVCNGIEQIERGEGKSYEGESGLKHLFEELRTEAHGEFQAERHSQKTSR